MNRSSAIELTNMCLIYDENRVLVQEKQGLKEKYKGGLVFPGGHVEPDESLLDSVIREIKEETGLEVERFLPGFRKSITYSPKPGVSKCVTFFIAIAKPGELRLQKEEVQDAYFLSPADAYITLSHDSDRRLIGEASYFEDKNN